MRRTTTDLDTTAQIESEEDCVGVDVTVLGLVGGAPGGGQAVADSLAGSKTLARNHATFGARDLGPVSAIARYLSRFRLSADYWCCLHCVAPDQLRLLLTSEAAL